MTITRSTLSGPTQFTTQQFVSPPITPVAGALLLVLTTETGSAASTGTGIISSTLAGMDTAKWSSRPVSPSTAAKEGGSIYWCLVPPGAGTGTITVNLSGPPNEGRMCIRQYVSDTGFDAAGPVVGVVANDGLDVTGTVSLVLSATPTVNDLTVMLGGSRNGWHTAPFVPGPGFAMVAESYGAANPESSLFVEERLASTSTAASISNMYTASNMGIALIIKPASGGATTPKGNFSGGVKMTSLLGTKRASRGSAAASVRSSGAVTTRRTSKGSGVGSVRTSGSSTGKRRSAAGFAATPVSTTGQAGTSRASRGVFVGGLLRAASFVGLTPSLGGGAFTGTVTSVGAMVGWRRSAGAGSGTLARSAGATGSRRSVGGGSGTLSRTGEAGGRRASVGTFLGALRSFGTFLGGNSGPPPGALEVEIGPTRIKTVMEIGMTRTGSATIGSTRTGAIDIGPTRTDGWSIGETRV